MPEGHVIHRLARQLTGHFAGRVVQVSSPQGRFAAAAAQLDGRRIDSADAWGKHLFIHFDTPSPESIVHIHLGLIGKVTFEAPAEQWGQIRLHIATDEIAANLRGPQWCRLITAGEQADAIAALGADPLREEADWAEVSTRVGRSKRSIASLLMDQKYYAGVGNIYRAEVLFRQRINPLTPGANLQPEQLKAIAKDLRQLMREGERHGWIDTVLPEHTPEAMRRPAREDAHGGEVYVYRRAGQECLVCGHPVASGPMEGRNLFWCPSCQS
ncbi:Fpg/Nei family DNA glycosylase [Corynebacterium ciconiae]|uniref:Fpg/Nei family DNA glycosylase n=1 Tax=Corynebacterium ciconiae TaxID=227319 RepID=UPI00047701CC|nr:DNA-formamidopyrimidine glycosylase family protein [Corynebacterium ciconiae]